MPAVMGKGDGAALGGLRTGDAHGVQFPNFLS